MPLSNLRAIKKIKSQKIKTLKSRGTNPYPEMHARPLPIASVEKQFEDFVVSQKKLSVAGRVTAMREHGGATFADLWDGSGKLQLHFKQDLLGPDVYKYFLDFVDIGDFIESFGSFFITRRGEQTQEVQKCTLLSKALLPLPEKWHGLSDVEDRFRNRHLDLLMNEEVRNIFRIRAEAIRHMRVFLEEDGFAEVETPILQTMAGGAIARPFKTKLNALDIDLYLRVAPELYLKRLLVGGYQKVYEIGRCFRNEGMDATHNPDFTMMECYVAYEGSKDMMGRVERMMRHIFAKVLPQNHLQIERDGVMIDFQEPFETVEFAALVKKHTGLEYATATEKEFAQKAKEMKVDIPKRAGKGKIADELYKTLARPQLIQPTFLTHHPLELSPLAKEAEGRKGYASRFQLIVGGMEIANGYSELNDPEEQRARFDQQEQLRKKGDAEAQGEDTEFLEALEYGMPPAAGLGVGMERLVALLSGAHSIREVMLFPTMRPKKRR